MANNGISPPQILVEPYPFLFSAQKTRRTSTCTKMTSELRQRYKIRPDLPMSVTDYARWVRKESGWTSPDENAQLLLGKSDKLIISAWENDTMVCTALAVPTYAPLSSGKVYFINNVITAKEHRRKGLARLLVGELLESCREQG